MIWDDARFARPTHTRQSTHIGVQRRKKKPDRQTPSLSVMIFMAVEFLYYIIRNVSAFFVIPFSIFKWFISYFFCNIICHSLLLRQRFLLSKRRNFFPFFLLLLLLPQLTLPKSKRNPIWLLLLLLFLFGSTRSVSCISVHVLVHIHILCVYRLCERVRVMWRTEHIYVPYDVHCAKVNHFVSLFPARLGFFFFRVCCVALSPSEGGLYYYRFEMGRKMLKRRMSVL